MNGSGFPCSASRRKVRSGGAANLAAYLEAKKVGGGSDFPGGRSNLEAMKRRKEKTPKGLEVPVPTKGEFDAAMRKVAPPAGRKRPDEKDRPQKQSG
jgi:hypothetical protein